MVLEQGPDRKITALEVTKDRELESVGIVVVNALYKDKLWKKWRDRFLVSRQINRLEKLPQQTNSNHELLYPYRVEGHPAELLQQALQPEEPPKNLAIRGVLNEIKLVPIVRDESALPQEEPHRAA